MKSKCFLVFTSLAGVMMLTACSSGDGGSTNRPGDKVVPIEIPIDNDGGPSVFAPDDAPADCLLAADRAGRIYCYSALTRTLRAWTSAAVPWWGFELPGEDTTNRIRSLTVVRDKLVITAQLNHSTPQRSYELSSFSLGGEFEYSLPVLETVRGVDRSHAWDIAAVIEYDDELLAAGNYGGYSSEGMAFAYGAYLARIDIDSGLSVVTRRYPGQLFAEGLNKSASGLTIELNDGTWLVNESTLELVRRIN